LYLISNYENGKKNGKETRYAFSELKEVPCDTANDKNTNPLDTCHTMVYQKIFETSYYKKGELHGPFEQKDSAGVVTFKGNFINGKRDGLWLESYVSTDLDDKSIYTFLRGNYTNGTESGYWDEFVTEDFIFTKYYYLNGKLNGKNTSYNSFKKPREEKFFENGQLKRLDIYDSLGIKIIRSYEIFDEISSSLKCKKTEYYIDGKISEIFTLKKENSEQINHHFFALIFNLYTNNKSDENLGYNDGEIKYYDDKDKILIEGSYYKNDKIGVWKYYFYDINAYTEQEFSNNIGGTEKYYIVTTAQPFSGKFIQKHENGKLKYEFKISEGLREGKSKYFDENGKIISTEKYEKGILQ
jgi:antitoxin component YwqK of YwqJK toxin-antitoxin module